MIISKCKYCGSTVQRASSPNQDLSPIDTERWVKGSLRSIMEEKQYCFGCAFWYEKLLIMQSEDQKSIRVIDQNWNMYAVFPADSNIGYFRGHGGAVFYIEMNDGRFIQSNEVWHNGQVPEIWRKDLPQNGRLITVHEWMENAPMSGWERMKTYINIQSHRKKILKQNLLEVLCREQFNPNTIDKLRAWLCAAGYLEKVGSGEYIRKKMIPKSLTCKQLEEQAYGSAF